MILLLAGLMLARPAPPPTLFAPNVISTADYERDGAFTPDGRTFYFTKRTIWPAYSVICVSHLVGGRWTTPEVAPFSGRYSDATPFISGDGSRFYIASRRPVEGGADTPPKADYDIWMAQRAGDGSWGEFAPLPVPVNTPGNELAPVEVAGGALYFSGGPGTPRIQRTAREGDHWLPPRQVGDTSDPGIYESGAYVSPDERFMVVAVLGRADAVNTAEGIYQRADLYLRENRKGVWSPLRHLPAPINSGAEEGSPFGSPDGKRLFFTSERGPFTEHGTPVGYAALERVLHGPGNGLGDIYSVPMSELGVAAAAEAISPELIGDGVISGPDDEFGGAFTADGKTVYFTRSAPHSYRYAILVSHQINGRWTTPVVAPFSGRYTDSDPMLSPDETRLYWSSDRPVDGRVKHDYDIWMVMKTASGGWGPPVRLPAPINSDSNEYFASATRSGTLYFSSTREAGVTGAIQAYRAPWIDGHWGPAENISRLINGPDTTAYYDLDVSVDPDEHFLMLSSLGRPDGLGHFDLYFSWYRNGTWTRPVHPGAPLNTRARDYSPRLTPDGKWLLFSSERGFATEQVAHRFDYRRLMEQMHGTRNGSGNIYRIDRRILDSLAATATPPG